MRTLDVDNMEAHYIMEDDDDKPAKKQKKSEPKQSQPKSCVKEESLEIKEEPQSEKVDSVADQPQSPQLGEKRTYEQRKPEQKEFQHPLPVG